MRMRFGAGFLAASFLNLNVVSAQADMVSLQNLWQTDPTHTVGKFPSNFFPRSILGIKGTSTAPGLRFLDETIVPLSAFAFPGQRHTNYRLFFPASAPLNLKSFFTLPDATQASPKPPYAGYTFETPASLACIYKLVAQTDGCDPNKVSALATGGSKAIGIVVAYDNATAFNDLQAFSSQFGLPTPKLDVIYATGTKPAANADWAIETSIDVQMAHALAPSAQIILVEAASNSAADLVKAVDVATKAVQAAGGGEVSMSYGGAETDASEEAHYKTGTNGVVFFAAGGDAFGVQYPGSSPNVVGVGGSAISRSGTGSATKGQFLDETTWRDGGGGFSAVFTSAQAPFQSSVAARLHTSRRAIPDIAAVADPSSGVWVYCGGGCGNIGWAIYGGASVSTSIVAALTNRAGAFRASSAAELSYLYSQVGNGTYFDVTHGYCGPFSTQMASAGTAGNSALAYDLCTGIGTPRGPINQPVVTPPAGPSNGYTTDTQFECSVLDPTANNILSLGQDAATNLSNNASTIAKTVCMSATACNNIVYAKFTVTSTQTSSKCADPADLTVQHYSDAQLQTKVNAVP